MPQSAIDQQLAEPADQNAITVDCVAEMVEDLFTTMLAMDFDATPQEACKINESDLLASVRIDGDRSASVFIYTSPELASCIAASMFGQELEELEQSDVLDALGEVVNVIGGNVKGILNQECSLSLPCVGNSEGICPEGDLCVAFAHEGQSITVIVQDRS